jgi:hypothetical protein
MPEDLGEVIPSMFPAGELEDHRLPTQFPPDRGGESASAFWINYASSFGAHFSNPHRGGERRNFELIFLHRNLL